MARRYTTEDLVNDVRSVLDIETAEAISDAEDILPALNRAQDRAASILSRQYNSPLLTSHTLTFVSGTDAYLLPEDILEDKVLYVEITSSGSNGKYYRLDPIDIKNATDYYYNSTTQYPVGWFIKGKYIVFVPTPNGTSTARIWYQQDPLPLVETEGRITTVNDSGNYIYVNELGANLSTSSDELASYVNIIDGDSGVRKGSLQIQSIASTKITFKTSPQRSSVFGLTVDASTSDITVAVDDYICLVTGTCIPFLKKPVSNYIIQYAVFELNRKLGRDVTAEYQQLTDLEKDIKKSWSGRDNVMSVSNRNRQWRRF